MVVVGILGRKLKMTQILGSTKEQLIPVTVVFVGGNVVTQKKSEERDGYESYQLAFGDCSAKNTNKSIIGHLNKTKTSPKKHLREIRSTKDLPLGSTVDLAFFREGSAVKISGTSKGKGTAGVTKRYHFKIGPMSHGASPPHRLIGPMGGGRGSKSRTGISLGKKMPGRMGNVQVTCVSVIEKIDQDRNLVFLRGSIPGTKNSLVKIVTRI